MSDDWLDSPVTRPLSQPTPGNPPSRTRNSAEGVPAQLYLVGQIACVIFGVYALFFLPAGLKIAGYLACGILVPFLWAFLFIRLRSQQLEDRARDDRNGMVGRVNRWLLLTSLVVGLLCAWAAATEWSK